MEMKKAELLNKSGQNKEDGSRKEKMKELANMIQLAVILLNLALFFTKRSAEKTEA